MRPRGLALLWLVGFLGCTTIDDAEAPEPSTGGELSAGTADAPEPTAPDAGTVEPGRDDRPALETLTGRASYYHDSLAGNSTASGEPYDPRALTAANRDLPFGTIIRVVRVDTGASVIVRVNDRGPFGSRARILDLSRAAAEELDMIRAGVISIRAEILERGRGRRR